MTDLFWYQREITYKRKLTPEKEGDPAQETVRKIVWDCFNVNKIIRGHWTKEDEFTILMDDGHEEAGDIQKPVIKDGKVKGVELKRERSWYVSQIPLGEKDAERFMEMYGKTFGEQLLKEAKMGL